MATQQRDGADAARSRSATARILAPPLIPEPLGRFEEEGFNDTR